MVKPTTLATMLALCWSGAGPTTGLGWLDAYNPVATAALHAAEPSTERVTWWGASDPHVGHRSEEFPGQHLAKAVVDVNELDIADYAILLGDLVADRAAFGRIFVREMDKLTTDWTYVLGNHDYDKKTGERALPPRFGAQAVHGIRFIMLSDEVPGHRVEASGHAVDRNLVMGNAH